MSTETISAEQVKNLRELTGAGMMDCKRALQQAGGDMDKAIAILREHGLAAAAKRAARVATEGIVEAYIHGAGKLGVLLELNCETDFVARTDEFKALARDLAMQVAATNPTYIERSDVPEGVIAREREIERQRAINEGKPERALDKIVEGRLAKFFETTCLMEQPFIKDENRKVADLLLEANARIGEKIAIRRFVRFKIGEE